MQKTFIVKKGPSWYVRYREPILKDGKPSRRDVWKRIAPVDSQYRSARSVEPLAKELLAKINSVKPEASQSMVNFIEHAYFPAIAEKKRPSTVFGYRHIFDKHLKDRLGDIRLFDFDASEAQKLLRKIENETDLSHTSLRHIKHFMAGVVTFAIQEGILKLDHNPIQIIEIPEGEESEETYAYNLDEIASMMTTLSEPARTVVAVAAFTGLRRSELRGLRWEDIDGDKLTVNRTVWNAQIEEKTKTAASKSAVPLVPMLQEHLTAHRNGFPAKGYIFAGEKLAHPLNLANLARRVIVPALQDSDVSWHGWHSFRRGLATNLADIGTPDEITQAILRHADIKVTRTFYIKKNTDRSRPAMAKLAKAFEEATRSARLAAKHAESNQATDVQVVRKSVRIKKQGK